MNTISLHLLSMLYVHTNALHLSYVTLNGNKPESILRQLNNMFNDDSMENNDIEDLKEKAHAKVAKEIHNCLSNYMKRNIFKCLKNINLNVETNTKTNEDYNRKLDTVYVASANNDKASVERPDVNHFSQDYVDFNNKRLHFDVKPQIYVLNVDDNKRTRRFEDNFIKSKILRSPNDSDDSSSNSNEGLDLTRKEPDLATFKYHSEADTSERSSSEELEIPPPRPKIKQKEFKKKIIKPVAPRFYYMQGPSRLINARRRLPHFLPKRYHWDEEDFLDLKNYWINGPQGKYSGPYKTPY